MTLELALLYSAGLIELGVIWWAWRARVYPAVAAFAVAFLMILVAARDSQRPALEHCSKVLE